MFLQRQPYCSCRLRSHDSSSVDGCSALSAMLWGNMSSYLALRVCQCTPSNSRSNHNKVPHLPRQQGLTPCAGTLKQAWCACLKTPITSGSVEKSSSDSTAGICPLCAPSGGSWCSVLVTAIPAKRTPRPSQAHVTPRACPAKTPPTADQPAAPRAPAARSAGTRQAPATPGPRAASPSAARLRARGPAGGNAGGLTGVRGWGRAWGGSCGRAVAERWRAGGGRRAGACWTRID